MAHAQGRGNAVRDRVAQGNAVREFVSPSGFTVYVGKNAIGNDYVSTQLIEPTDLWFHASDCAGCHVLLKTNSSSSVKVSKQDTGFCKQLATQFSKRKTAGCVIQARGRDVIKPPGAAAGTVGVGNTFVY